MQSAATVAIVSTSEAFPGSARGPARPVRGRAYLRPVRRSSSRSSTHTTRPFIPPPSIASTRSPRSARSGFPSSRSTTAFSPSAASTRTAFIRLLVIAAPRPRAPSGRAPRPARNARARPSTGRGDLPVPVAGRAAARASSRGTGSRAARVRRDPGQKARSPSACSAAPWHPPSSSSPPSSPSSPGLGRRPLWLAERPCCSCSTPSWPASARIWLLWSAGEANPSAGRVWASAVARRRTARRRSASTRASAAAGQPWARALRMGRAAATRRGSVCPSNPLRHLRRLATSGPWSRAANSEWKARPCRHRHACACPPVRESVIRGRP